MNLKQFLNDSLQYMQNGNVHLAEKNLKIILSEHPNNADALSLLGIIFIHQKKFKKGKDLIQSSLRIIPNQPQAILNLGLAFYQENNFDKALNYFNKAIDLKPDYAEAFYCKGLSLQKKNMVDDAINSFEISILKNPFYMDPIINLGYQFFEIRQYSLAVATFSKGLNIQPNNTEILNMIGNSYNELREYDKAVIYLDKSLLLNPIQEETLIALGHAFMCQNNLLQSLKLYNNALKINSSNVLALNNRANVYYLLGQDENGIIDLDRAIKIDKLFSNLYNTYGNILTSLGRFNEALEKYNQSIDIKKSSESFQNRGVLFYKQEKYDEALKDLNTAISINPEYSDALNSRGVLYKELGKCLLALKDFRKALRLTPSDSDGLSNIAELYAKLKRFDKAYVFHKRAIKETENPAIADYSVAQARYNFSVFSLALQDFSDKTWDYYSNRKSMKFFKNSILSYTLELEKTKALWDGLPCGTLLIFGEQGLGDQIIAMSLLQELKNKCNNVIYFSSKKIIKLFERSFKEVTFVAYNEPFNLESIKNIPYNFFAASWDIGKFFRSNISDFKKQPNSFLRSDEEKTKLLKADLQKKDKKICGLSWLSKAPHIGNYKSIKLSELIPILNIQKLNFVNLQYGDVENEIADFVALNKIRINLYKDIDKYEDIDSLASLIDACDFVVTTSNLTAHIAGGLGKETYLLVPYSSGKIWYWHENDFRSIWYPSVKIFRQGSDFSWRSAILSIAKNLEETL